MRDLKNYLLFEFFVSSLTPMQSTLVQANEYTDTQVAGAIAECKAYTDAETSEIEQSLETEISEAIAECKAYTDSEVEELRLEMQEFEFVIDVEKIYAEEKLNAYNDYLITEVEEIKDKLLNLNADENFNLMFSTDMHAYTLLMSNMDVEQAIKNSMFVAKEINRDFPISAYVNNGDFITSGGKKSNVLEKLTNICDFYADSDLQILITKGNHDDNGYGNEERPDEIIYDVERHANTVGRFYNSKIVYDINNSEKSCYYYDDTTHKIRVLCINTCDFDLNYVDNAWVMSFGTSGISNAQLNFIGSALQFAEPDWSVFIIGHHCLRRTSTMGTTNSGINLTNNGNVLWEILKAFKNKTSYASSDYTKGFYSYSVNFNYTNNASNDIIACISGHTHSDKTDTVDGIRLISVDSGSTNRGDGRIPSTETETSIDIFTIDKTARKIYVTRYGYGADRVITY